jgi:hypothetical protein
MPDDESARVEGIHGKGYSRLAKIKLRYDPANMFRMNQNIRPRLFAGVRRVVAFV